MRNINTKLKFLIAGVLVSLLVYVGIILVMSPPSGFMATIVGFNFQVTGTQCFDGNDNDGDGLIDHPADPGCDSTSDDNETDPSPPGGGGGGGGGSLETSVTLSGRAYPLSNVTVLKDGQIAIVTIAGPDANFDVSLTDLSSGNYTFSVYAEDSALRRSSLFTFPVRVTRGANTSIGGIFLSPTIDTDKIEVRKGDNIAILGQSSPDSTITISVNSNEEIFLQTASDGNGVYLYNLDTSPLEIEQHLAKSKSAYNGEISPFGRAVGFTVGTRNVVRTTELICGRADLNCDGRVNLVDFSIAAFWYKRPISPEFSVREKERLNGDGKVDLVDFSIMAFFWTG